LNWQQFSELVPDAATMPEDVGAVLDAKAWLPHFTSVAPPGQTSTAFWVRTSLETPFFPHTTKVPVAKSWVVTRTLWLHAAIESANITIRKGLVIG